MDTPTVGHADAGVESRASFLRNPVAGLVLFALFFLVGSLAVLYPYVVLGCIAVLATMVLAMLGLRYLRRSSLDAWQMLLLLALSGYMILNYGFENLTIHVGFPLIISYALMFASLFLAAYSRPQLFLSAMREPAWICLFALLLLTCLHLVVDFPQYGLWAIRDASMYVDAMFLLLGLLWAMRGNSIIPLLKWLVVILLLNAIYSFTLPMSEQISDWSPKSGVFIPVSIFGNHHGGGVYLLLGAPFYVFLARYVVKWPRWLIVVLAMAQLLGLALFQMRALYIGLIVIIIIFAVLGETSKSAKLLALLSPALVAVLLLTTLGIEIQGRIGPVETDFFKEHLRSITGAEDTPGMSVRGRVDWYDQALQHIRAHPVIGEGFGMVLIDDTDDATGAAVRQPHNSSISLLARLGATGLLFWILFHVFVLKKFLYAFRQRHLSDKLMADLVVWLFMVYVIFMIEASVEPTFEFPTGSIPFFFFLGLALGLIRLQFGRTPARATAHVLATTSVRA